MWYVVDCEEGAQLICGFNKKISRSEFEERIKNNTLDEVMNYVPVKKGDVFFIKAGTLHAIGKDNLSLKYSKIPTLPTGFRITEDWELTASRASCT